MLNHSEVFMGQCDGTDTVALNVYQRSEVLLCSEGAMVLPLLTMLVMSKAGGG